MAQAREFDPDDIQMSIGDHLEELRHRIILGLLGLVPAVLICLVLSRQIVSILCRPLFEALKQSNISSQLYSEQLADGFMVCVKLSFVAALAIVSPWIVYQLWLFVRSGLYIRERKIVTKYIPLSIGLLIAGMFFVYFLVLPWSLQFFIQFTTDIPLPQASAPRIMQADGSATLVQAIAGDPASPHDYQIWFNTFEGRLKMFVAGQTRVIPFGPADLVAMHFTMTDYVDLVLQLLLTFALAFQLPLVVLALHVGIVELATLKRWRRHVYLSLAALAAFLAPGDVVTASVALMIPLVLLYELGILLAARP